MRRRLGSTAGAAADGAAADERGIMATTRSISLPRSGYLAANLLPGPGGRRELLETVRVAARGL